MRNLQGFIAHKILLNIEKKGFFSGRYVVLSDFISHSTYAYEESSLIGYTYRNNLSSFIKLSSQEGRSEDLLKAIGTFPDERLSKHKEQPKNFNELFFNSELIRLLKIIKRPDLIKQCEEGNYRNSFKLKIPYDVAYNHLQFVIIEGIGFGSHYTELTEKFINFEYDEKEWSFFHKAGLDIGEKPLEKIKLPERQKEFKEYIEYFVKKYRPELLNELQL